MRDYSDGKHKYLLWIAKQLEAGHNESDISASLKFFHENSNRLMEKNINAYQDLKELEDLIKNIGLSKRKERQRKKEASVKIYEDDNFLVMRIDDKDAMSLYGAETKWCTTMIDQTYYEEYVCQGHDFYILISKTKSLRSAKYAIVRKGLLSFEIFDDQDSYAREFSDKETQLLYKPVQAIVADLPPKNVLWLICNKKMELQEASDWMKTQSSVTQNFVGDRIPELRFLNQTPKQIISYILESSGFGVQNRITQVIGSTQNKDFLKGIAQELAKSEKPSHYVLKLYMCKNTSPEVAILFKDDKDARIRAHVASVVSPEEAVQFLNDTATTVVDSAAKKVAISTLLDFMDNSKSKLKKRVISKALFSRISEKEVIKLLISQPRESLIKMAQAS